METVNLDVRPLTARLYVTSGFLESKEEAEYRQALAALQLRRALADMLCDETLVWLPGEGN